jgi:hypothetical protein
LHIFKKKVTKGAKSLQLAASLFYYFSFEGLGEKAQGAPKKSTQEKKQTEFVANSAKFYQKFAFAKTRCN